ncbi:expressed unknown protein [Seminavis robusta]|uniref:VWFD domain-containing protein n=1 Tax=Seminavis robusta TaxID=568900 RepID=A0A9N8HXM1_9STRA|nr:expressed unknown protein [Seminavis robusta]|eukprot:Sro2507_g329701.1  (465) ;mRNA; f:1695-3089
MKFLSLALLALLPATVLSTPVPLYCETFSLEISAVSFGFQNWVGGSNVNYDPAEGEIEWGQTTGNNDQSGLDTASNVPGTVIPGPEFAIGTLTHNNNPITGSALTHVELVVTVTANGMPYQFVYQLSIHETPNSANPCPYPTTGSGGCSDRIFIIDNPSPQTVMLAGGVNFEIDLLGFRMCPNCPIKTQFISQERQSTSADLYANLVLTDCPRRGGGGGDPHFETWTGHKFYDYMGACDLHLVQAPHFAPALPLTVDVRTKIRSWYSFIESAVVQIGDETLEIGSFGDYVLNGVQNADMPNAIAGFEVNAFNPTKNVHILEIYIDEQEKIILRAFKDMVTVKIDNAKKERFHGSSGMMGEFETGHVLARDGITRVEDPIAIANEWQIRDTEPMLFNTVNGPQYPEACAMPERTVEQAQRRLGGSAVSKSEAVTACAHWSKAMQEACVSDVMATGDLELAEAGEL